MKKKKSINWIAVIGIGLAAIEVLISLIIIYRTKKK